RGQKTVTVKNTDSGECYQENYDILVLATGASPVKPPIPGSRGSRIMTLWTIPDVDQMKKLLDEKQVQSAVIVGGGFVGLEMAENLHQIGITVTVVESGQQVMASLDYELAQLVHENLIQNGVKLFLADGVKAFEQQSDEVVVKLNSGKEINADLVLLAIGVAPNGELAKAAGLEVNQRGGLIVDAYLRSSDPSIYGVGDLIQVTDLISGEPTMIPLAGPANKQGRIVADNIVGAARQYQGTQGTAVVKIFDLTAASTGANEKTLIKRGLIRGKDYQHVIISQNSHAGYYPGAVPLTLKLLFSMDGKQIFGAQIVGGDGVDKRIDVLAVAIRWGAGIAALTSLELAYAPPYSSAKDPVNMAGFAAENVLTGKVVFADWDALEKHPDALVVDVREDAERLAFALPGAVNIPLGQLRDKLDLLDRNREIITFCAIGVRAYLAARILLQQGFSKVKLYPGGTRFYQSTHYQETLPQHAAATIEKPLSRDDKTLPTATVQVDCSGLQCPGPLLKVFETIKQMREGEIMEVSASDPGFVRDIGAWCRRTGNELVANEKRDGAYVALVKKVASTVGTSPTAAERVAEGKTIIVFSGDLDKVLASFIIANGAAAMGRPVTMFFTFWGLNVLRKPAKQKVSKTVMESLFGAMMPRGSGKLKLSKMNMGGMGTAMMKKIMQDKNVDSLEQLIKKAMAAGVKIVACTMSMDVMGIKEEELIPGVALGGVGAYLGDAEESNVNLFI
ncbi:MAG: DsrE/DsrF/DrsH-like family protein, partial [Clostridiales bacterium]